MLCMFFLPLPHKNHVAGRGNPFLEYGFSPQRSLGRVRKTKRPLVWGRLPILNTNPRLNIYVLFGASIHQRLYPIRVTIRLFRVKRPCPPFGSHFTLVQTLPPACPRQRASCRSVALASVSLSLQSLRWWCWHSSRSRCCSRALALVASPSRFIGFAWDSTRSLSPKERRVGKRFAVRSTQHT